MRHHLSFCDIEQLSDNVFETIAKNGITLDKKCADENWIFWQHVRDKPFGLLINCKIAFHYSFEGAREIGKHPLQQKTAILLNNDELDTEMKMAIDIKNSTGDDTLHQFFSNRNEAIEWLSEI
jgi:hypothetical protein